MIFDCKLYYHIIRVSVATLEHFHIGMLSYAASFSIKMCFVKLTLFISRTKQNYTKSSTAPESELKIKAYYAEYFNEILLMSAVRCKQRI